jgi:hypothetical protein
MFILKGLESNVADPCNFGTDPDPDPRIHTSDLVTDLQDVNQKSIFILSFSAHFFLKVHLRHFSKIKSHKEVTKQ